ncbi:hypothetical protein HYS72_01825 [Candidatus Pacearchaeota archaeon]|nr:hypothetical protein [Candidatus Pacearchaeota archaeon]
MKKTIPVSQDLIDKYKEIKNFQSLVKRQTKCLPNERRSNKIKMKTKIMSVFLMSVLMLSVMGTFVLAHEDDASADAGLSTAEIASAVADDNVETSSGIFGDKVRAVFARNSEKRAEIKTKIAAKKMHKLKETAKEHPEKAKELAEEYKNALDSASEDFNEIAVDGDKEEVIHALKQTVVMKYRLESHQAKSAEVHAVILARQSEKMNEEQLAHLTEVFGNINEKVSQKISEIEALQENLIARLLVIAPELTEEQIRVKLETFENSLDEKRQLRAEEFKSKIEAELKEDGELIQKFELKTADGEIRTEIKIESGSDDGGVIALN